METEGDEQPAEGESTDDVKKTGKQHNPTSVTFTTNPTFETAKNYTSQQEEEEQDDDLNDWELIDDSCVDEFLPGVRPLDYMNDPFKDKWKNTAEAYHKRSPFGYRKTYRLLPMMVKANDDCR